MSDVLERLQEADDTIKRLAQQVEDLGAVISSHEAEARSHNERAKAARAERVAKSKELDQWLAARNSIQVRQAVEGSQQAAAAAERAAKAHEETAAAHAADLERMKAEVAAELEKLKAANKPA